MCLESPDHQQLVFVYESIATFYVNNDKKKVALISAGIWKVINRSFQENVKAFAKCSEKTVAAQLLPWSTYNALFEVLHFLITT